ADQPHDLETGGPQGRDMGEAAETGADHDHSDGLSIVGRHSSPPCSGAVGLPAFYGSQAKTATSMPGERGGGVIRNPAAAPPSAPGPRPGTGAGRVTSP